jgi:hypothetical protein
MAPIRIFAGNLSPSITDTIKIAGTAFNLTGSTVKFRMRAAGAYTLKVDAAATIVNAAAGTVRYDWAAADVDTPGDYLAWWHVTLPSTDTQDTPEFQVEIASHSAASGDLTTITAVRQFMQTPSGDTGSDEVAAALITRASQLIMRWIDRRVAPLDTSDTVRLIPVAGAARTRDLWVGDLSAAPTTIRLLDSDAQTEVTTVASTERLLLPLDRSSTDPIEAIRLLPAVGGLSPRWYAEVTGKWGWPVVPADIEHACIITVVTWLRRGVQALTAPAMEGVTPTEDRPSGLPVEAETVLRRYRTVGVA